MNVKKIFKKINSKDTAEELMKKVKENERRKEEKVKGSPRGEMKRMEDRLKQGKDETYL